MKQSIKLADVAKAAGVSQGTASNVFNRPDIVREEVRERVEEAARALGYAGPDPKGRLLRAGKVNAIGVVSSEPLSYFFEDPFARVLMTGISQVCDEHGAGISLVSAMNEEKIAWNIQSAIVDGFVLLCIESGERLVQLSRERKLPFVALQLETPDDAISALGIDDFTAAQTIARHVCALGHRQLAILSLELTDDHVGPIAIEPTPFATYTSTLRRIQGYCAALSEFGIDSGKVPIFETLNDRATVETGLEHIFAQQPGTTAILAMSDRIALIALEWLRERGLSVPGDISVVGFDGVPEGAISKPPLTTMTQPIEKMGRLAVQMILAGGPPRREILEVELTVRGSTAPPRSSVWE